jgi:hypothetical protein
MLRPFAPVGRLTVRAAAELPDFSATVCAPILVA